jgi:hypothetical protein
MAAVGQIVSVGTTATLVFKAIDSYTYETLTSPAANIFQAKEPADTLPIYISVPTGSTVYFGGSGVTATGSTEGCPVVGPNVLEYNAVASDSLYGVVASGSASLGLLVMRQSVAGNA